MIISKLIGGLGNQMFQYAAGRALSIRLNTQLALDANELAIDAGGAYTQRQYQLNLFDLPVTLPAMEELNGYLEKQGNGLNQLLYRLFPDRKRKHRFEEHGPGFHPELLECGDNVYLSGFWQCERYFLKYEEIIRKDFTIKNEYLQNTDGWLLKINASNSVSLHIRRGDYISNPNANAFHGTCSPAYYQNALKKINNLAGTPEIFIFSDDMAWCKENVKADYPIHLVETGSAAKDLYLMSHCRHNIIANSSFSWWGAWLNRYSKKIVVAPAKWFNDPSMQQNDIVPVNWIKLQD